MKAYRKQRIDNIIKFFAIEHFQKTSKNLTQTQLWKYLAFFDTRMLKKTGVPSLGLEYVAWEHGPVPFKLRDALLNGTYTIPDIKIDIQKGSGQKKYMTIVPGRKTDFDLDYFSDNEIEEMFVLIEIFADRFVKASDMSEASHQDIVSWRRAWKRREGRESAPMDLSEEFPGNIRKKESPSLEEENYLAYEALQQA